MQRSDTQILTADKFIEIVKNAYDKYHSETEGLPRNPSLEHWHKHQVDVGAIIRNAGYTPAVADVNFSSFSPPLISWLSNWTVFSDFKFSNCTSIIAHTFRRCEFYHSRFAGSDCYHPFYDCLIVSNNASDEKSFTSVCKVKYDHSEANVFINEQERNPLIGLIYTPSHGTSFTDDIISIFENRGASVVKLYTENRGSYHADWVGHPLLSHPEFLDGIVLPGGANVITDPSRYTQREKVELRLVEMSLAHKIPLLGVCRGHQFVGHYFGAELKYAQNHQGSQIYVLPRQDSKLFQLTKKKFISKNSKGKVTENIFEIGPVITYKSMCAHSQGVFFKNKPDERVRITAQSVEGLPESLQVDEHIITFQHHHEGMQNTTIGKGVLKMFSQMVATNLKKKTEPQVDETNEHGKRENTMAFTEPAAEKKIRIETEIIEQSSARLGM